MAAGSSPVMPPVRVPPPVPVEAAGSSTHTSMHRSRRSQSNHRHSGHQSSASSIAHGFRAEDLPLGTRTPQSGHASWLSRGNDSSASFQSSVQMEEAKPRWDSDSELKQVSKSLLRLQKWALLVGLCIINGVLIWVSVTYHEAWVLFIILLSSNTILQFLMILCIIAHFLVTRVFCFYFFRKEHKPEHPERMVMLLPCYNETLSELTRSLDSLIAQKNIDDHPRLIFIIVDGNVKGPGMDKTTQQYLLEDILEPGPSRVFENGYRARDGLFMPTKIQTGFHRGIPYVFVGKKYNQGKRDSLCFARSFMYHYQMRSTNVVTMFSNDLFEHIGNVFMQSGLEHVEYLVGMDADTVFDDYCVWEMVREIRKNPKLVGVCGHVCVDYDGRNWGLWSLYQSVEYSQTQGLRRMFQSRVTGKVNCLPGCCQLIKVDKSTFGDEVLRERFGYCPKPNDLMTLHIMGNYSEDSIHASIIFSLFPKRQTAQALRAKAYTVVPQSWNVFLSQRKRWALGAISNEFVMIFRPGIIPVERLQSVITVITWAITPFIMSALVQLVIILVRRGEDLRNDIAFLTLISILAFRYLYSFCIGFWLPRSLLEKAQYFIGYFFHLVTSPFINMVILAYSLFNSDDFKWGKTREVVSPDGEEGDGVGGRNTF
ncbi:hypothetical protein SODALDRAFT_181299 [Sodiomyces alkalinus F11]|uniref:chitin synthase n=1 Tax=Sodiomyces alkalinus (strain CBS 110278 / VKM F-3762 / F11) TaxID=1314773 RepID=A0A3N2PUA0_SODAK|nr:hypothetical protein SODALDRAFT_181299 [Sodiomyces alkalinus F11]ROT38087.1 hypothetical protein SODALDRAFT_181299 [Sodiomyces alkalinus F11]